MTIETKFNHGEIAYMINSDKVIHVKVGKCFIETYIADTPKISYKVDCDAIDDSAIISEERLFRTKEELLASL